MSVDYSKVFNATNRPNYISAPQGKLYINGIHIDECYDVQYMYQELKQPVYGYNSKYYDAILPGQVTVAGSFTINYIHDQYLLKVLQKAREDQSYNSSKRRLLDAKTRLSEEALDYKNKTKELKTILDKNKAAKDGRPGLEILLDEKKLNRDKLLAEMDEFKIQGAIDKMRASNNFNSYLEDIGSDQASQVNTYIDIWETKDESRFWVGSQLIAHAWVKNGFQLYLEIKKQRDTQLVGEKELQRKIDEAKEAYKKTQASLDAIDIALLEGGTKTEEMRSELSTLKSRMNAADEEIVLALRGETIREGDRYSERAESSGKFTIMLEYNGQTHKVITGVELLGHSHVMGHGGNPVQEVYKFVARNVE